MVLEQDSIFPTSETGADEFFISEAEKSLKPRIVVKDANEVVTNSEVIQDDDELFMALETESTYDFVIYFEVLWSGGDIVGIDYTFKAPTGATGKFWEVASNSSLNTDFVVYPFETEKTPPGSEPDDTKYWFQAKGYVKTGATTGNLQFQWAQRNAGAGDTTTIYAGSWMEVTKR